MKILIFGLAYFLISFILLIILGYIIPKKKKMLYNRVSLNYIITKYKLNVDDKRKDKICIMTILLSSIAISIPLTITTLSSLSIILCMAISLVIFSALLMLFYNLIGFILKKKGW